MNFVLAGKFGTEVSVVSSLCSKYSNYTVCSTNLNSNQLQNQHIPLIKISCICSIKNWNNPDLQDVQNLQPYPKYHPDFSHYKSLCTLCR